MLVVSEENARYSFATNQPRIRSHKLECRERKSFPSPLHPFPLKKLFSPNLNFKTNFSTSYGRPFHCFFFKFRIHSVPLFAYAIVYGIKLVQSNSPTIILALCGIKTNKQPIRLREVMKMFCRITPGNYEEIKKLIILAGVFFMVAILFFLMKLEVRFMLFISSSFSSCLYVIYSFDRF